jgi:hypothetical protein
VVAARCHGSVDSLEVEISTLKTWQACEEFYGVWNVQVSRGPISLLMTPVPLGERRSSGVSAPHSVDKDESHVLVDVCVTDIKEGCALGILVEHLDDEGLATATEIVGTFRSPDSYRCLIAAKGTRLLIKWLLTGARPSSTFSVQIKVIWADALSKSSEQDDNPDLTELVAVDLSTLGGLRSYLGELTHKPQARA